MLIVRIAGCLVAVSLLAGCRSAAPPPPPAPLPVIPSMPPGEQVKRGLDMLDDADLLYTRALDSLKADPGAARAIADRFDRRMNGIEVNVRVTETGSGSVPVEGVDHFSRSVEAYKEAGKKLGRYPGGADRRWIREAGSARARAIRERNAVARIHGLPARAVPVAR